MTETKTLMSLRRIFSARQRFKFQAASNLQVSDNALVAHLQNLGRTNDQFGII